LRVLFCLLVTEQDCTQEWICIKDLYQTRSQSVITVAAKSPQNAHFAFSDAARQSRFRGAFAIITSSCEALILPSIRILQCSGSKTSQFTTYSIILEAVFPKASETTFASARFETVKEFWMRFFSLERLETSLFS